MLIPFENEHLSCTINYLFGKTLDIAGEIKNPSKFVKIIVTAAAPIDRMSNYTGSGLPWPCRQYAFDNTPNYHELTKGVAPFACVFDYPNSYYDQTAFNKLAPAIEIHLYLPGSPSHSPLIAKIDLPDPLPLKTLVHRPGRSPAFYARQELMEITGQETYLRSIAAAKVSLPTG